MISVLRFEEAEPATYPDLISYDEEGTAFDPIVPDRALWLRIESYIAMRWTSRQAIWSIQGPGVWEPHLTPVSNITVDQWDDTNFVWTAVALDPSPLGGIEFPDSRTYKISGTVGDTVVPVPQLVIEAYMRLQEYCEDTALTPAGSSSYANKIGDGWDETITRSPNWLAKALQSSGAADLLRAYRRI